MSTLSSPAPASLASIVVIPEEDFRGWRLNSSEPLVRLHAKFWGRGMPEDDEWRDYDPTESEFCEDDEIKPGCRVLDIDNEAIVELKEIWVRVSVFTIGKSSVNLCSLIS